MVYSFNPQVHAFDDLSVMETLEAQAATVKTARGFCDAAALRGGVRAICIATFLVARIPLHVGTHFDFRFLSRA